MRRNVLSLLLGAGLWAVLVTIPESNLEWALVLAAAAAFVLGLARFDPWRTGILLNVPALLTAGWVVDRGDEDGLWILIYPVLVFYMVVAAGLVAVGRWLRSRTTSEKPADHRT